MVTAEGGDGGISSAGKTSAIDGNPHSDVIAPSTNFRLGLPKCTCVKHGAFADVPEAREGLQLGALHFRQQCPPPLNRLW